MRRFAALAAVGVPLFLVAACRSTTPPAGPEYQMTTTIRDIMDSLVDKSADVIWDSVATIVTQDGVEKKQPRTDEEWAVVRRSAVQIIEATNLIVMPGRHVARPGEKAADEKVELPPEEIERLITADRASWVTLSHALHDDATSALKAIDSKDPDGLMAAGEKIDTACENCHLKYWYPNDPNAGKK